ncbi:transposase [Eubacterium sp.]|uniref:transposase n=1 Tax=Eubacterium sp. TaxID=142586 RepID=UPI0030DB2E16
MKYPLEVKVKLVQECLEEEDSINHIAEKYAVSYSALYEWISQYQSHGITGLKNTGNNYTGDFKVSVVEYKKKNALSSLKTAGYFNIPSRKTVDRWEKVYDKKGPDELRAKSRHRKKGGEKKVNDKSPRKNTKESKQLKALQKENEELRAENAYLKKLQALVSQESNKRLGKKQQ